MRPSRKRQGAKGPVDKRGGEKRPFFHRPRWYEESEELPILNLAKGFYKSVGAGIGEEKFRKERSSKGVPTLKLKSSWKSGEKERGESEEKGRKKTLRRGLR